MFFRKKNKTEIELDLAKEVKNLSAEVSKLKDLEFMKVFKHPVKFMWFSFLKGLMIGFGSVLGASVLVAIFIYVLAQISLVPIIGDFVQDVMGRIENVGGSAEKNAQEKLFIEQYNNTKQNIKN